jgi:hypothetical protein
MRRHPELKRNLVGLLIGDVFRPEANRIFDTMIQEIPLPDAVPLITPNAARVEEAVA